MRDAILQQADYEEYGPTEENIISIVEAKLAVRAPGNMEVDALQWKEKDHDCDHHADLQAVGKGGVYCHRCGGQGHIAAKCATPELTKGKGKGKSKDGGK